MWRVCATLCLACGCGGPATTLLLDVRADAGFTPPDTLSLSLWNDAGPLVSGRMLHGRVPGSLLVTGLPPRDQTLRVVIADSVGRALGGLRVAVTANQETRAQLILSDGVADGDGDGVPDDIDDCPSLADAQQDHPCGAVDAGGVADQAAPADLAHADLAHADDLSAPPITRVAQTSGVATLNVDHIQLPPPAGAQTGDLVLLLLDRYSTGTTVTSGAVWTQAASQTNDGDTEEVAWRIAAADEQTDSSRYNFPAVDDASWALFTYRNAAHLAQTSSAQASAPPFTVPQLAVASAPALVVNAVASGVPAACTVDADLGGSYVQTGIWHVVEHPLSVAATVPADTFSCGGGDAALFQVRITP